ncbi:MAG: peptidyl-prolyl cis-trans isomerase [Christensenella sp.]|nr:peptidyl-prolyl cis-trans isomerase [Christensenella sp.]
MKHKTLITVLLVLTLAMSALLGGCQSKDALAATIGDREITVQQLKTAYASGIDYASYYGYDTSTAEGKTSYRDYMLDSLISTSMKVYQAKLAGITLTADEQTAAEQTAQKNYDDTFQSFVDQATQAGASNPEAYAKTLFTNALVSNKTTVSKLKATMLTDAEENTLISKHKEALLQGVSLSEDELAQKYADELAAQKEAFTTDPSLYFSYESYSTYGYSAIPLFVPEGFFRVRQILVADEATAALVKQKIDAGEDFEALLKEYNTDPGMQDEANAAGYLVGTGASYVESFLNAALALTKDGDVSAPVQSDYGWHIIKRVSTEASHEIPYADVKGQLDAYEQTLYQNQYYSDLVAGWVADKTLVTKYPDNYASIGQ